MICWKKEWNGSRFNFHFYEQEYSWVFDPLVLTKQKKLLTLQWQCQNEFSWMLDKTKISFRTKLTLLLNFLLPVSWTRDPENIVISTVLPSDCRLNDRWMWHDQLYDYWTPLLQLSKKNINHTGATTTIHFVVNSCCWISVDSYCESCCYTGSIAPHKLAIESFQCFSQN